MKVRKQNSLVTFLLVFFALICVSASAQKQKEERRERTIDEIKTEAIHRAEVASIRCSRLIPPT